MGKKFKYRFKTEEELLKEFGRNWADRCNMNNEGYMNYLLGTPIDVQEDQINENGDVISHIIVPNECPQYSRAGNWSILPRLIIKFKFNDIPNYKPRKFVY